MRWSRLCIAGSVTLLSAACGLPPSDLAAYREEASRAVLGTASESHTVQLALESWRAHRLPDGAATVIVRDADEAMGPLGSGFAALDPPTREADRVRDEVETALAAAEDAVAAARIALGRDDAAAVDAALRDLTETGDDLDALAGRLR